MMIRTTKEYKPGVLTFYIQSSVDPAVFHTVKYIRQRRMRRYTCTCLDFVHRRQVEKRLCKHARAIKLRVDSVGARHLYNAVKTAQEHDGGRYDGSH